MANRREFLKNLGIGAGALGAGAFMATLPQLPAVNASSAPVERFVPTSKLLDRNMIYEFKRHYEFGTAAIITANPREEYRPYLVDLYANNVRLDAPVPDMLAELIEKSLELAMTQDTRGWSVQKWNKELLSTHKLAAAKQFEKASWGRGTLDV